MASLHQECSPEECCRLVFAQDKQDSLVSRANQANRTNGASKVNKVSRASRASRASKGNLASLDFQDNRFSKVNSRLDREATQEWARTSIHTQATSCILQTWFKGWVHRKEFHHI